MDSTYGGAPPRNNFEKIIRAAYRSVDVPITWFRETIVEPNRPKLKYYHREFRRVPTLDECYQHDEACIYEAQSQFKRDRKVDSEILNILRQRRDDCIFYEKPDHETKCVKVMEEYALYSTNWFIKYGDTSPMPDVREVYMKQKHRLIWERRHGVGGTINDVNANSNRNTTN